MGMPEEALKHGEVYACVTPNIAHAQHMYGHDLQKVNRNSEAVAEFQRVEQIGKNISKPSTTGTTSTIWS
jgi:hypothetical protein